MSPLSIPIKITAVVVATSVGWGCSNMNRTGKGGLIGAGSGAVVGGVIGKQAGNTAVGAIIGAAVGGATGAAIGRYMDKQAAELQNDLENAKVERVGEGIKITFNSGILFDTNASILQPAARQNIAELAKTLNKYPDTNVIIEGHTDSTGSTQLNQQLSKDRAEAVANYLVSQNVASPRIRTAGMGAQDPVATNESSEGRQANRRVEIAIIANQKLKKAAQADKI